MRRALLVLALALILAVAFSAAAPALTTVDRTQNEKITRLETQVKVANERITALVSRLNLVEGHDNNQDPRIAALEAKVAELGKGSGGGEPPAEEPKEEPPVEEPPHEEPSRTLHCFSDPAVCGYPAPSNTGARGSLTPSGSITASTAGQVIEGKEVTGSIRVTAPNVTIRNVKVVATASGSGSTAISLESTGAKVIDTTVVGKGSGNSTLEAAVRGFGGATLEGVNFTLCSDCVEGGSFVVRDSYMKVSSIFSGAHAENIYVCSASIDVEHSTLLNEQGQTATVFGDTICGGANSVTVKNSLLAGGGYVFYPQANGSGAGGQTVITGNHIARCTTAASESSDGHWLCKGGPDSAGYFPNGGGYNVGAYFGGPTTWANNVWDDNGQGIPEP